VVEARKQLDQTTAQQTAAEQQLDAMQQQVARARSEIVDAEARLASLRQAAEIKPALPDPGAPLSAPPK